MSKYTNSKQRCDIEYRGYLVSVIEILNFEFIWNLVLVFWFFTINYVKTISKAFERSIVYYSNFRAPDLIREKFSGGPDIKGTYKNCRKIKRKFKMQQHLQKARIDAGGYFVVNREKLGSK